MVEDLQYLSMDSPVGELLILGDARAVCRICFQAGHEPTATRALRFTGQGPIAGAKQQLQEYFAGTRKQFTVPVAPGGTDFQLEAWRALQAIPYGETRSYGEQARSIGRSKAFRAVGAANGRNPIPIIIPCHRVVGANGTLTGYAGGLDIKRFLLGLEQAVASGCPRPQSVLPNADARTPRTE